MSESAIVKCEKASNSMSGAYGRGETVYPRVGNDYIDETPYPEHAHPPLTRFDDFAYPLQQSSYPLSKETIPLELANTGIATPATLMNNLKTVDRFFDKQLDLRGDRREEFSNKMEAFHQFLESEYSVMGEEMLGEDGYPDVNKIAKDGYVAKLDLGMSVYRVPLAPSPERRKKSRDNPKKKIRDDIDNYTEEVKKKAVIVSSFEEALIIQRKKKLLLESINAQKEALLKKGRALSNY